MKQGRSRGMLVWLVLLMTVLPLAHSTAAGPFRPVAGNSAIFPQSEGDDGYGGDFLVSTAGGATQSSAIATNADDDQYLVVWEDYRHNSLAGDIYGQIYSAQGVPLGEPIAICTDAQRQEAPAVAYNDSAQEYLVVWSDFSDMVNYEISGRHVSTAGNLIGEKFPVTPAAGTDHHVWPDIVYDSNADHYLVVWENESAVQIEGQLLDNMGSTLLPNVAVIAVGAGSPKAAYNSNRFSYMVVYEDVQDLDIYGQAVAADGTLTGNPFSICDQADPQYSPSLAFNSVDFEYLVVWEDIRAGLGWDIYGRRFDEDGNLLGSEIIVSNYDEDQFSPAVAYNPNENQYLVTWEDLRNTQGTDFDIYGQRIGADGSLAYQGNLVLSCASGMQSAPALAYSTASHQYLLTWRDKRSGSSQLYGQRLHWSGFPLGHGFMVSAALESHEEPAIAYNPADQEYLVVWEDDRDGDGETDIWAQRYHHTGLPLGDNFPVREETGTETHPVIAYNPDRNMYLVVWEDESEGDVEGQLLAGQGALFDKPFNIAGGTRPAVAYNTSEELYLVVFGQYDATDESDDIYGRHLSSTGPDPARQEFVICDDSSDQNDPVVAYDEDINGYVVVWADKRYDVGDILGKRVWPNEMVGSEQVYAQEADAQLHPVIAWNSSDHDYLVVWHDYRDSGISGADIYGQKVQQSGAPEGGNLILSSADGDQQYPYVNYIHANNRYYVAWQDNQGSTAGGWDIYGRWVGADGSMASLALPAFRYVGWQLRPAGAYNPDDDQGLTVWQDGRNGAAYKVHGRFGTLDLEPPVARFTRQPTVGFAGTTFTFDARASRDNATPSGALIVRWDLDDDGDWDTLPSLNKVVTRTVATPGVYTVTLGVWDLMFLSDTVSYPIYVLTATGNTPPTATLSVMPDSAAAGSTFTADASASTDAETPAGLQARWDWENNGQWDTAFSAALTATHVYTVAGDYTIRVEIADDEGLTDAALDNVTVVPGAVALLNVFPNTATVAPREVLQFRAYAQDGYGNPMFHPEVSWSVLDPQAGEIDAGGVFTASAQSGDYADTILVESDGVSDTASVTIYALSYQIYLPILTKGYQP